MALKLDNSLLEELGLGALPESEKQLLLRQIYEKLEMNVGMRLADQMSNEQLDAFEKFVDANDDKGAFQWLEGNFPNYKQVVNDEFEKLKNEIRSVAPQILANAPAADAATTQQPALQQAGFEQPQPAVPQQPQYGQPAQQQQTQQPQQYGQQPAGTAVAQAPQQPYGPGPVPQQPAGLQNQLQQAYAAPQGGQQPQYGAVPQNGHLQPQYGYGGAQPQSTHDAPVSGQGYPPAQPPQDTNGQQ